MMDRVTPMAVYRFGTSNDPTDSPVYGEGVELDSLDQARSQAVAILTELIRNAPERWDEWAVTATDHAGLTLFRMRVGEQSGPAIQRTHSR